MRKIIAGTFISLDGLFAGPNGEQEWTFPYLSEEIRAQIQAENKNQDTIILGEKTYDLFKNYWPNVAAEQDKAADFMNNTPKIVISDSLKEAPWGSYKNTSVLGRDVVKEVKKLKAQEGRNIIIVGSGSIVQQFTNAGLIDEYNIVVLPIILGAGRPLFENIEPKRALNLLEHKQFANGAVMLRYEPAA